MLHVVHKNETQSEKFHLSPVIKILAYFSLFDYPLTKDEIIAFLPPDILSTTISSEIDVLISGENVYCYGDYFMLVNDPSLIHKRSQSNQRAQGLMRKAMDIGAFISRFPFVTGVGISGSLSKNAAAENADIDFFIVTAPNRLWIARTLLHLYKKIMFIFGRQHYYCMNYFVDELALRIPERNIYTAIEICTMIPVKGNGMKKFTEANSWTGEWLASYAAKLQTEIETCSPSLLRRVSEWIFSSNWLDGMLMKTTRKRWEKKMSKGAKNHEGMVMNLQLGKHFARSNPGHFQEKLLNAYNDILCKIEGGLREPISSVK